MESQTVLKTAGGKTLTGSTPVPSAKTHTWVSGWIKMPRTLRPPTIYKIKNASETKADDSILTETGA